MDRAQYIRARVLNFIKGTIFIILLMLLMLPKAYAATNVLEEAREIIRNYYINEVPDSKLNSAASIDEMVELLGDPFSTYFTAQEYKEFTDGINNKFSGIGVHIEMVPEGVLVVSVIEGSPAYESGILPGDIITNADGHSLYGLSSEEAVSYIKGHEGTIVHLIVNREGRLISFDIVRREIAEPTVSGYMIGTAGYIKVSSFGEDTVSEFEQALEDLKQKDPTGYIIDLRYNPGGYLTTAIDLAAYFMSGSPIVIIRDKSGYEETLNAPVTLNAIDKPVTFLINEYSASASEVLAAAVKDNKKAFIIGTKSYGKGTVQSLFQLSDGSVLKLTVYQFFSPQGSTINKVGITPDLDVGDADALMVCDLLMEGGSLQNDNTGYLKVGISDKSFKIDLKKAALSEYREAFVKILEEAMKNGEIYIGTNLGWSALEETTLDGLWRSCLYDFDEFNELLGVPLDKVFNISFSAEVDASLLSEDDIELFDTSNGREIMLSFENTDGKNIRAVPAENLKAGGSYILIINDSVKGKNGERLKKGVFTHITAAP